MALPDRDRVKMLDGINVGLDKTLNEALNTFPKTTKNTSIIALQYWIMRAITRRVKNMLDYATGQAEEAGIIFDAEKNPREPGKYDSIYHDTYVVTSLEVRKRTYKVDPIKLKEYLVSRKQVSEQDYDRAVLAVRVQNKLAHVFSVTLLNNNQ